MPRDLIDSFVETYVEALHDQNAAVFAGAGLSIPAGLVNWKELLRDIASDIGLDVDKEDDLISVAQFHFNERDRSRFGIRFALVITSRELWGLLRLAPAADGFLKIGQTSDKEKRCDV